ncbi:MAG: response regulator [Magnetococcales bacterium]|nr:response regulator [Magnetococcales bacterium]
MGFWKRKGKSTPVTGEGGEDGGGLSEEEALTGVVRAGDDPGMGGDSSEAPTTVRPFADGECGEAVDVALAQRERELFTTVYALRDAVDAAGDRVVRVLQDRVEPIPGRHRLSLAGLLADLQEMGRGLGGVLATTKPRSGRLALKREFVDGHYLVAAEMGVLTEEALSRQVTLVNAVPEGSRLFADRILLGEVLRRLLYNAIRFSPEGKPVKVFTPKKMPTTLAVWDQGPGIPEVDIPGLFRGGVETRPGLAEGEGRTGLFDLPFCREIVEAHGGILEAQSREGEGSVFSVQLPLVKPKVLIVDDQEMDREMLGMFLGSLDVVVSEAESAGKAMALIDDDVPDLIVTDITMPGMDGFDFLRELGRHPRVRQVPVILVTGNQEVEQRVKAFRLGAADFTVKPVVPQDFLARVRRLLG